MTKREQIMSAVLGVLEGATISQSPAIYRSRVIPLTPAELPAINLEPLNDQANANNLAFTDWVLNIRISVYAKGDIPDSVADPIIEDVHTTMMSDETLGGLIMGIYPKSVSFDFSDGDGSSVAIYNDFELRYRT